MSHTLSTIIVNYNAGPLLRKCVDSWLACPLDIEIIVVDNASSDASLDGLQDLSRVCVIRNPVNVGFAAACNIGVQASSAPFLLFLNPDCFFQPDAIAPLLAGLQSGDRVGMVGGLLVNEDGTEQGGGGGPCGRHGDLLCEPLGCSGLPIAGQSCFTIFICISSPCPTGRSRWRPFPASGGADFVALLNPDAFAEAGWLAALVAAAHRYPEAAAFGSRLLSHADPTRLDGAGDFLTLAGKPGRRGHRLPAHGRFMRGEAIFSPCTAAALYRTGAVTEVGGFDESFFCYVEDVDLAFRLLLAGYGARYVPESVVRHMGSAVTGRRSAFAVYHGQRNLVFNYVKNMPGSLFWLFLLPHLLLNVLVLLGASLAGRGPAVWRAKRDTLRCLPTLWAQRRTIQSQRRVGVLRVLKMLKVSLW